MVNCNGGPSFEGKILIGKIFHHTSKNNRKNCDDCLYVLQAFFQEMVKQCQNVFIKAATILILNRKSL